MGGAIHPNNAISIAERAAKTLSPAHRLVARAYEVVSTLCASHAAAAQRTGGRHGNYGSQVELRMQAVEAAEKHVKICECIAARCHGGIICTNSHPAVFECAKTVFFAAQDLMQLLPRQRSSGALAFVARYIGHMRTMHGEADTDVAAVQKMVQGTGGEYTPLLARLIYKYLADRHAHLAVPTGPTITMAPSCLGSGATLGLKRCARCKTVYFCDTECQSKSWLGHKAACKVSVTNK